MGRFFLITCNDLTKSIEDLLGFSFSIALVIQIQE